MKKAVLFIITCLMLAGCVKVELCDFSAHPHQHILNVSYHWPADMQEEERPDSMYILANRLFNTIRYQFNYNLQTNEGELTNIWSNEMQTSTLSKSRNGEGEGVTEGEGEKEEEITDSLTTSELSIRNGQYQMFSFNNTHVIEVDSLDEYMRGNTVKSSSLSISYKQYEYPQFKGKEYTQWVNFNKGYSYIDHVRPLYMVQQTVDTESRPIVDIDFEPEVITQEITFNFDIQLMGRNVVVDSVRAELSGISRSINLYTKYIDMDATKSCKVIFDATPASMTTDSIVPCTGKVHVLGVMNSEEESMKTGPGILYIAAYVHTTDTSGAIVKKTCYAGVNLRSYILEQPLTLLTEDGYHHTISQTKATINIMSRLPISREEILANRDPEYNLEYWFKEEGNKGDHDLEV